MSEPIIRVENLGKKYTIKHNASGKLPRGKQLLSEQIAGLFKGGFQRAETEDFWALRSLNLEVKQGEVLGVVGRNGAGKSTLLKLLSRITEPSEGRAQLNGRVASLLEVGTGFHPELTGRENIYLNGAILGMSRREIRKKFDEIVAFSEVERFLDTPVKRYSSGMYVRLAFAVAAHLEPEILIVDEVLAVGDAAFQKKCLGKMRGVAESEGRTVLFVSHNLAAVRSLCSRAILLENGKLIFEGDTASVTGEYLRADSAEDGPEWKRPQNVIERPCMINYAKAELIGEQPNLKLRLELEIKSDGKHDPATMGITVVSEGINPLGQSMPSFQPIIPAKPGVQKWGLEIDLPGIIPGNYGCSFWLGVPQLRSYDVLENIVQFQVVDSPMQGRAMAYNKDQGYFAPTCRLTEYPAGIELPPTVVIAK